MEWAGPRPLGKGPLPSGFCGHGKNRRCLEDLERDVLFYSVEELLQMSPRFEPEWPFPPKWYEEESDSNPADAEIPSSSWSSRKYHQRASERDLQRLPSKATLGPTVIKFETDKVPIGSPPFKKRSPEAYCQPQPLPESAVTARLRADGERRMQSSDDFATRFPVQSRGGSFGFGDSLGAEAQGEMLTFMVHLPPYGADDAVELRVPSSIRVSQLKAEVTRQYAGRLPGPGPFELRLYEEDDEAPDFDCPPFDDELQVGLLNESDVALAAVSGGRFSLESSESSFQASSSKESLVARESLSPSRRVSFQNDSGGEWTSKREVSVETLELQCQLGEPEPLTSDSQHEQEPERIESPPKGERVRKLSDQGLVPLIHGLPVEKNHSRSRSLGCAEAMNSEIEDLDSKSLGRHVRWSSPKFEDGEGHPKTPSINSIGSAEPRPNAPRKFAHRRVKSQGHVEAPLKPLAGSDLDDTHSFYNEEVQRLYTMQVLICKDAEDSARERVIKVLLPRDRGVVDDSVLSPRESTVLVIRAESTLRDVLAHLSQKRSQSLDPVTFAFERLEDGIRQRLDMDMKVKHFHAHSSNILTVVRKDAPVPSPPLIHHLALLGHGRDGDGLDVAYDRRLDGLRRPPPSVFFFNEYTASIATEYIVTVEARGSKVLPVDCILVVDRERLYHQPLKTASAGGVQDSPELAADKPAADGLTTEHHRHTFFLSPVLGKLSRRHSKRHVHHEKEQTTRVFVERRIADILRIVCMDEHQRCFSVAYRQAPNGKEMTKESKECSVCSKELEFVYKAQTPTACAEIVARIQYLIGLRRD